MRLRLFPIDCLITQADGFSHTILNLGGLSWDLGAKIRESARRLPDDHHITTHLGSRIPDGKYQGERCYGTLTTDAYGEPYQWLTVRDLLIHLDEHWPKHPVTAYVRALPAGGLIVLDWH
jgi:hypothetical protein